MTKLTSGRMRPWPCGHKGFGSSCVRCAQANDLEKKANEIALAIKGGMKTLPAFLIHQKEVNPGFLVRVPGNQVFQGTNNTSPEAALNKVVMALREAATNLLKRA